MSNTSDAIADHDEPLLVRFCTLTRPSGHVIRTLGTSAEKVTLYGNWISGGSWAVVTDNVNGILDITNNRFGRDSTSGLYLDVNADTMTWTGNVYDDDGSTANQTDTAPL